jgi:hypothetical protein
MRNIAKRKIGGLLWGWIEQALSWSSVIRIVRSVGPVLGYA